jgi:hypothetical protein
MRNRTRVIAVAAVTAALAAGSTASAMASTTGDKPSAYAKTVSVGVRCEPDGDLAGQLGVSPDRLDQAMRAVKISLSEGGAKQNGDQFDTALASELGIPQAQVRQAFAAQQPCTSKHVRSKSGHSEPAGQAGDEALAAAVAGELHVSTAQVSTALQPLFAVGHADPSSPTFAAAAGSLGVSTQQLSDALVYAKQSLAGSN